MSTTLAQLRFCHDWRTCSADDATALVQAEVRAWRQTLRWDVAEAWSVLEPARRAGQLPGLVAYDEAGQPAGWTAYLPHNAHLQVMALVAHDDHTATALADGILASAEARSCGSVIFCVRDMTPGLAGILRRRRFDVDIYRYLVKDLTDVTPAAQAVARWREDEDAMAELCRAAYRHGAGLRAFAPDGTLSEWRQYIATLVQGTACGWFLPELSFVVPSRAGGGPPGSPARRLDACLMLTDLGTGTVHIAQLAVDPSARGRGLGRQLVSSAIAEAGRFYDQVSLLVSGANGPAARLYESFGFRDHATFIVASRSTPIV